MRDGLLKAERPGVRLAGADELRLARRGRVQPQQRPADQERIRRARRRVLLVAVLGIERHGQLHVRADADDVRARARAVRRVHAHLDLFARHHAVEHVEFIVAARVIVRQPLPPLARDVVVEVHPVERINGDRVRVVEFGGGAVRDGGLHGGVGHGLRRGGTGQLDIRVGRERGELLADGLAHLPVGRRHDDAFLVEEHLILAVPHEDVAQLVKPGVDVPRIEFGVGEGHVDAGRGAGGQGDGDGGEGENLRGGFVH